VHTSGRRRGGVKTSLIYRFPLLLVAPSTAAVSFAASFLPLLSTCTSLLLPTASRGVVVGGGEGGHIAPSGLLPVARHPPLPPLWIIIVMLMEKVKSMFGLT